MISLIVEKLVAKLYKIGGKKIIYPFPERWIFVNFISTYVDFRLRQLSRT